MNKSKLFAGVLVAMLLVLSCDAGQLAVPAATKPVVNISSPPNGGQVSQGQEVVVQVGASDNAGITRVELWVDGVLATMPEITSQQATVTAALRWTPMTSGPHTLTARATNASGLVGESPAITVNVASVGVPTIIPSGISANTPSAGCIKPTIYDFSAKPTTVQAGETAGISWNVSDAESAMLIGGEFGKKPVSLQGSEVVKPSASTTYVLHIESCAGPYDVSLAINVTTASSSSSSSSCIEPFIKFGADRTRINAGESITLEWYVDNATAVTLHGGRFSNKAVPVKGTETDTPQLISPGRATSITYTLRVQSCAGPRETFVVVNAYPSGQPPPPASPTPTATPRPGVPPPPPPPPPLTCSGTPNISSFTGSPLTIAAGGSSTLSWGAVTNADRVEINQGIGGVATPGSRSVSPGSTTTYTLTASCGANTRTAQVTITVTGAAPTFAVTSVSASVNPSTYSNMCPANFNFSAVITTNGAGTVTYRWERSDGGTGSTQSRNFTTAGSQTVTTAGDPGIIGAGWYRLHVLTPNSVLSNQASFTNSCTAVFRATNVTVSVSPRTYSGACPASVNLAVTITANGAGVVRYGWTWSPAGPTAQGRGPRSVTFTGPGTFTDSFADTLTLTGSGTINATVFDPNSITSNNVDFTNNCH